MELPQPGPFGAEGGKLTQDFLSLCSPAQDPRSCQGGCPTTHDFLRPLEGLGKKSTREENTAEITTVEKPPPPAPPPPPPPPPPPSSEHLLPGGIRTYSISHIPYFDQRVLKPEGGIFAVAQASSADRNETSSNCSSYTGSGFTLWEESAVMKGKTGKENAAVDRHVGGADMRMAEAGVKIGGGQWTTSERPSQSSSNNTAAAATTNHHRKASTTFSSLSSSQPLSSQKNQTFMDMLKSAKVAHDEDDDEEEEFVLKKESSPNLKMKVGGGGGKSNEQKPNTPRSKHSATEQRRRSKINDRFQKLRELIPNSDQKRDKASFLLEVIEYIQYLQEKVHKYEGSYQRWNQEPPNLMPWRNSDMPEECFVDQSRAKNCCSGPSLIFPAKFDENNVNVSPANPRNGQNAVESDMSTSTTLKDIDHPSGFTNKVVPLPVPLQPNIFTPSGSGNAIAPIPARVASDMNKMSKNMTSQPQSQSIKSRSRTDDAAVASNKIKEQELTIESGKISISTVYSQGLLNTLTQALQSSGVDLSQARISVQIDIGKRSTNRLTASTSTFKDTNIHSTNPAAACSRRAIRGEETDQALKRLKTS